MFAEFNWWLLIVGLVVGAGLTWLVLADARRREVDLEDADLADEAAWLERRMTERGDPIDIATAEHVLQLHRVYLGLPPAEPFDLVEPGEPPGLGRNAAWSAPPIGRPEDGDVTAAEWTELDLPHRDEPGVRLSEAGFDPPAADDGSGPTPPAAGIVGTSHPPEDRAILRD